VSRGSGQLSRRVIAVAVALAAVTFVLVSATGTLAADSGSATSAGPVIDTGAPVTDSSQCTPCHLDLGTVKKPGLMFNHGNHLLISCDGCHSRIPHQNGATDSVPMEVCFACHGVSHGPQGPLATAECDKCHTPSFDLVPADHQPAKSFSGKAHAELARRGGVNQCMMCHTASKDCNDCHAKKGVKIAALADAYVSVVAQRPQPASVKIYPSGPTNMAQCQYCHPDLDNIVPGRLIFAHAVHLQRDYACETCHPTFGHTASGPVKPDMQSCYRCHGLQHQSQGLVATAECNKCHPPGFKLTPNNHTARFIAGGHKDRAGSDPSYCSMCHKTQFCVQCHQGKSKSPGAPKQPVVPKSHQKGDWQAQHGKLFIAKKGDCGACHDDASCRRCHKTTMPHPANWIENHKPEPGVSSADCNICHTDRQTCQNCHHQKVANAELVASSCVGCHPEAAQQPPTSIQDKGIAEHAVHFNVAKKKGRPYHCFDCHVSFGTSAAARKLELQQGHDLRLCYQCHGAVDPLNNTIAPYRGAELCLRCHKNLGI
jgi:Cytochrome c7 and related cytochrome c